MDTMPDNDSMEKQTPLAGLDPAELLKQGAAEDTLVEGSPSSVNPPPMEEIAAAFPQFEILELIGRGGMGAVYKVRQKDLDRIVALKILPPGIGQSPEFSSRFTREARALAKLNHPGIVTLHEFGQQDGLYFILMEFVDGVNLAQLMKTGRVSPREALAIVPQICDALQYAHDQGIVHRDIKPENILLDRQGRVKVADFGIAKVVAAVCDSLRSGDTPVHENQTLVGKIIGTPQYMAPEQIDHPSDVDHRADIYALGVVFYQMLTGELPGKNLQAPSRKVSIDVRLDEMVLRALAEKPERRYQTALEFRTVLDGLPPATPPPLPKRGMMRRWWWVYLAMIPMGLMIGLAAGWAWNAISPKMYEAQAVIEPRPTVTGAGSGFLPDQMEAIKSRQVLLSVALELKLHEKWSVPEDTAIRLLNEELRIENIRGTDLLSLSVRHTSPQEAAEICNSIARNYAEIQKDYNRPFVEVVIHETAVPPTTPASPNATLNLVIGSAGGLLLSPLLALILIRLLRRIFAEPKDTQADAPNTMAFEKGSADIPPAAFNDLSGTSSTVPALPKSSFSRMAIIGACWPVFLLSFVMYMNVEMVAGEYIPPPAWLRIVAVLLMCLAYTAPFGTTILGWIAVSQIRRSAGKLHGMWLAVFDGLLFPLLIITGLIGWFWHWVFYDLMRAAIIAGQPELTIMQRLLVANTTAFTVLATLITALLAGFFIILRVWRAVNANGQNTHSNPTNRTLVIGVAGLALGAFVLLGIAWFPLVSRDSNERRHRQFMADFEKEVARAKARAEELEKQGKADISPQSDRVPIERRLAEYDWRELSAKGRLRDGVIRIENDRTVLKIENLKDEPLQARLLTIEKQPISAKNYALCGEIRYENVKGTAYLEMWSEFPEGRYFSRTLGEPGTGPMSQLAGTSGWREFSLPFDRTGTKNAPTRLEVNLHLPGRGVVYVGPLKLVEYASAEAIEDGAGSASHDKDEEAGVANGKAPEAVETWLAGIDAGEYDRSWKDASEFFQKAITEAGWSEALTKLRKPLGAMKSRKLVDANKTSSLPGAPDGKYVVMKFETSFTRKEKAIETVSFALGKDGTWKAAGYFIR